MPVQAADTWACLAPADSIDLQAISRRLLATGVTIKEVRIREPDLTTLFVAALNEDTQAKRGPQ